MITDIKTLKTILEGTLPDSFRKDDLVTTFQDTRETLKALLKQYADVLKIFKDEKIEDYSYFIDLNMLLGIKSKKTADTLAFLLNLLQVLDSNKNAVEKLVLNIENDVNIKDNINLRAAVIYKVVSDYYFFTRFLADILNYALDAYRFNKTGKEYTRDIKLDMSNAGYLADNVYSYSDNFAKDIEKDVPDIQISLATAESDSFLDTIIKKIRGKDSAINLVGTSNFKNNIIYIIGKMITDIQIKKAKTLKDKVEMIKYKILEAEALNEKGEIDNEQLAKAIAKYEEEIDEAEYKIERILKV